MAQVALSWTLLFLLLLSPCCRGLSLPFAFRINRMTAYKFTFTSPSSSSSSLRLSPRCLSFSFKNSLLNPLSLYNLLGLRFHFRQVGIICLRLPSKLKWHREKAVRRPPISLSFACPFKKNQIKQQPTELWSECAQKDDLKRL